MQASRSHYCIHKTVSKKPNLDEECEALLEDNSCKYFGNAQKLFGMQTSSSLQVSHLTMGCRDCTLLQPSQRGIRGSQAKCKDVSYCIHFIIFPGLHTSVLLSTDCSTCPCRCMTLRTWSRLATACRPVLILQPVTTRVRAMWLLPSAQVSSPSKAEIAGPMLPHSKGAVATPCTCLWRMPVHPVK